MTDNFIDGLRALAEKHPRTVRSAARMRQPLDGADAYALEGALVLTEKERDEAQAKVESLREAIRTIRARCVELDDSDAVSATFDIANAALEDEP